MDKLPEKEIKESIAGIIKSVGEDINTDEFRDTPDRVFRAWKELLEGYDKSFKCTTFPNSKKYDQIIAETHLPFYSLCSHHLLPVYGVVHIGYLPDKKVFGLSKLGRIVDKFARRLQMQEDMGMEIADFIENEIEPKGVMVVTVGEHFCMSMRGYGKKAITTTSVVRGTFREDRGTRDEFLQLISLGIK